MVVGSIQAVKVGRYPDGQVLERLVRSGSVGWAQFRLEGPPTGTVRFEFLVDDHGVRSTGRYLVDADYLDRHQVSRHVLPLARRIFSDSFWQDQRLERHESRRLFWGTSAYVQWPTVLPTGTLDWTETPFPWPDQGGWSQAEDRFVDHVRAVTPPIQWDAPCPWDLPEGIRPESLRQSGYPIEPDSVRSYGHPIDGRRLNKLAATVWLVPWQWAEPVSVRRAGEHLVWQTGHRAREYSSLAQAARDAAWEAGFVPQNQVEQWWTEHCEPLELFEPFASVQYACELLGVPGPLSWGDERFLELAEGA